MTDDTIVFLRISRKESRNIFECNQRNIETVAKTDKTTCFVAGVDVKNAGKISRLIGYDTYRTTCHAGKADDDILCKVRHDFEEITVVYHAFDNVFHIIRYVRICRNDCIQRSVFAVGFVGARLFPGFIHIILR